MLARRYHGLFIGAGVVQSGEQSVSAQAPIALLATVPEAYHIYHQYVVRAFRRDELRTFFYDRESERRSTIPSRCTCRNASLTSAIRRATFRSRSHALGRLLQRNEQRQLRAVALAHGHEGTDVVRLEIFPAFDADDDFADVRFPGRDGALRRPVVAARRPDPSVRVNRGRT